MKQNGKATTTFANITKKAGSVLESFGATLGSMAVNWVIGEAISLLYELSKVSDNIAQQAKELGNAFSSTESDISNYKNQIEDLYGVINDSTSTHEEVTNARKQLLEIQDEMITKYGTEKDSISLVTQAIAGQIDAFKELTDLQWQEKLNKFTSTNQLEDIWLGVNGYDSKLDEMFKKMEGSFKTNIPINYTFPVSNDVVDMLKEYNFNGLSLDFDGNVFESYDQVIELQKKLKELNDDNAKNIALFLDNFAQELKGNIETYGNFYKQYTLYEEIFKNNSYEEYYNNLTLAYQKYQDSVISGDEELVSSAIENFQTRLNNTIPNIDDISVKYYLENMYPEMEQIIKTWEFETKIVPNFDLSKIKGKNEEDVFKIFTEENATEGTQAFESLIDKAKEYGVCIGDSETEVEKLIDILVKLGYVQREISDGTEIDNGSIKDVFSLTESNSKAIDDFQNKIKTLGSALEKLRSGELDDGSLIDLKQEFTELQGESGNLEHAIINLITNALETLYETLGENIPTDLKDSLQALADEATNVVPSLSEAFSSIKDSHQALEDFKKAMSTGMTDSVLSSVASLSSHLNDMVAGFYAGIVSADELYKALREHYNTDLKNYSKALIEKNKLSDNFYNNLGLADTKVINQFKENYGIDLKNCKNYAEAKQAIEEQCLKNIAGAWTEYYDVQSHTFTQEYGKLTQQIAAAVPGSEEYDALIEQQDLVINANLRYKKALEEFEKITYDGIEAHFSSISSSFNSSGSGSSSSSETIFDWIETRIKRTEEVIDGLNDKLESVSDFTSQNAYIDEMLSSYQNQLSTLDEAKKKYMELADAVGLSASYIEKIQNGTLEIDRVTDETVKKKINEYQQWYDKAQDVESSIRDIIKKTKELNRQKLDNIINDYNRVTALAESYKEYHQTLLDIKEAKGDTADESDYNSLIQKELDIQATLLEQYKAMEKQINELNLSPSSDEYYEMQKELVDLKIKIEDCTSAVEGFKDSILEIRWNNFETGISLLDDLSSEISDVVTLLGDGDIFKDGEITDIGMTKLGLYAQQYVTAKKQIAEYENAIARLEEMYRNGVYSQEEYTQKLIEFRQASRDAAKSVKDMREEILEFNRQAIEEEIDDMRELVNSKKEALDAEKELNDYRNSILDKQKNIRSLENKIASLSRSDAREDRALRLQLEEKLAEAKRELADEQYKHSIETQKDALDETYENFEKEKKEELDELENNLDKQDELIEKYLDKVLDNYDIVYDNIQNISDKFGITFTESLTSPWESAGNAAKLYGDIVGQVMSQININSSSIGTGMTGTSLGNGNPKGQWIQETNKDSENYGRWWYKHSDGSYTQADWENIDNKWYCFDKNGWMGENEWVRGKAGEWYYLGSDGAMVSGGWKKIDGKDYCFDDSGKLYQNGYTPDGWYVDKDGVWDESIPQTTDEELIRQKAATFDHYAKGISSIPHNQYAVVDEKGEEIIVRADDSGRVDYLTKGSSVIPADISSKLIDIAKNYNPTSNTIMHNIPDYSSVPIASRNVQPISVNITSPLMHVDGGLDSSILSEVAKMVDNMPKKIYSGIETEMKRRGIY